MWLTAQIIAYLILAIHITIWLYLAYRLMKIKSDKFTSTQKRIYLFSCFFIPIFGPYFMVKNLEHSYEH